MLRLRAPGVWSLTGRQVGPVNRDLVAPASEVSVNSVRNRLALLFFAIVAAAVGFIYLYVVPQLRSSLTAEQLRRLEAVGSEQGARLDAAMTAGISQQRLRALVRGIDQRTGSRVTVLGVREGDSGPQPSFVVADSELERTAVLPGYPAASVAAATGSAASAVETVGGERRGESAIALSDEGEPRWVAVFSTDLADVDDNVDLIRRQILIAGTIALLAALGAGWLVARAHARRLRRLEKAAEKIADGDFSTPIPVDSSDEVGQLAVTFNEMQKRLERLDSARREFIANASHELRTPIFSLSGFVELLEDDDPDPEARAEFVRTMREQVARLDKLTVNLLDLSKLDADAIQIRREPVELGDVARRLAGEFGPAAERHESAIEVGEGAAAAAAADPDRVAQIMRILIDNALTHTPEGTTIKVGAHIDNGSASLVVADDGPGIELRARERVFERFYTGDEVGGSGLGLAIARELALRMDGTLELRSRRGRTEFELRLPAGAARSRG
ncbi:MAG: integral rane sensor signal transduction histidine kinase [Solirubrobacterales bacterium]|nr:integral rane sensor signal transduction histidine kinase [Solirubrobacterales bacterium]